MSSVTSTEKTGADAGLQPWQFFLLAALACATAVTFMVRGQGLTSVVLLSLLLLATTLVGVAALRTVGPLVTYQEDRTPMVGERTRTALEREKMLALRAIKELEFDRAMGKVSDDDFHQMSGLLRARAARLISQLDSGEGYRSRIEKDVAKRLSEKAPAEAAGHGSVSVGSGIACGSCSMVNDPDARFCKACGTRL